MKNKTSRRGGGDGEVVVETTNSPSSWDYLAKCVEQYSVLTIVFSIVALGFYYVIHAPGFLQFNLEKYFLLLCVPLLVVFYLILNLDYKEGFHAAGFKVGGLLLLAGVVGWLYTQSNMSYYFSLAASWTFLILILVVALAFVYGYAVSEMRRWKGWAGFVAQLLFFLPCLLRDAWTNLMVELRMTSVSIYLALVVEIALVVVYVCLPQISQSVMGTDSRQAITLLTNPMRLSDASKELTSSDKLWDPENATYRKNYAISMWIYLTPHSQQMAGYQKETEIFSYGFQNEKNEQLVKPMIRYYGGGINSESVEDRNKFVFYFSRFPVKSKEEKNMLSYDVTLLPQRWNYVVMNYSHNEVNLFINGEIEHTFSLLDGGLPIYHPLDKITVGDPKGSGVQGGICNVVYYKHTLTPEQVAFSWNLMKDQDPPLMTVSASSSSPSTSTSTSSSS